MFYEENLIEHRGLIRNSSPIMAEETLIPDPSSCYVCCETSQDPFALDPLPCVCKGGTAIHVSCLSKIIEKSRICSICKTRYHLAYLPTKDGLEMVRKQTGRGEIIEYTVDEAGRKHGMYSVIDSRGQSVVVQGYEHGIRQGLYEEYYSSGTRKSRCHCVNNRIHGRYTEWFENGAFKEVSYYHQGLKHGPSTLWKYHDRKCIRSIHQYVHGVKH